MDKLSMVSAGLFATGGTLAVSYKNINQKTMAIIIFFLDFVDNIT